MKTQLVLLPLIVAALSAGAQTPPLPPPPDAVAPPPTPDVQTLDGSVKQYLLGPGGEVEGLLLSDGTQVAVPPHLQSVLTMSVKPNDAVRVRGNRESGNRIVAQEIDDASSGTTVIDNGPDGEAPPAPLADDGALTPLVATGNIATLLSGPRGEVNGAVLDDGSIIRFAPRAGLYYADRLKLGARVSASGIGTQNAFGRVIDVQELRGN